MSKTNQATKDERPKAGGSGRLPTTWSEEKAAVIIDRILDNAFNETAALAAGVPKVTFYSWLTEGRLDGAHPRLRLFVQQVDKAQAEAESGLLATINMHAIKSWQAAAWIAERKWPDKYGRPYRPELKEDPKALPDKELIERLLTSLMETEEGQTMLRAKLTVLNGGKK